MKFGFVLLIITVGLDETIEDMLLMFKLDIGIMLGLEMLLLNGLGRFCELRFSICGILFMLADGEDTSLTIVAFGCVLSLGSWLRPFWFFSSVIICGLLALLLAGLVTIVVVLGMVMTGLTGCVWYGLAISVDVGCAVRIVGCDVFSKLRLTPACTVIGWWWYGSGSVVLVVSFSVSVGLFVTTWNFLFCNSFTMLFT